MATTVNISFKSRLWAAIDKLAKKERRSRSELLREAARMYIERKNRWHKIFALGQAVAKQRGLSEKDIASEIQAYRRSKSS